MRVAICVHGRFHAFELAEELHRVGALAQLTTTFPSWAVHRFLPATVRLRTAPWLELIRRLHQHFGGPSPDTLISTVFGRFAARSLPEADIFVGWSSASLEAAREARRRGMRVVIERGSTHIEHQQQVLANAYDQLGLPWAGIDPRLRAREAEEYALADQIVTGCTAAAATFAPHGVDPAKVAANPYGVNLVRFGRLSSQPRKEQGPKRILFVGQVGVRKGVPWLLEAFARLDTRAELHLVGPVDAELRPLLSLLPIGVVVHGPLHGNALVEEFSRADVFCLPSIEEGFGMVLLQAMAAGLPVVASTATGAVDIPTARPLLVPPANTSALTDALTTVLADADGRGEASREAVRRGFSWADYGRRTLALYGRLIESKITS